MKNPLTQYGLFGWNYWYLLLHPWVIGKESYYHTKWFVQRGWRGYADCDAWGLDSYLSQWLPEALESLRTHFHGYPVGMTPKGWNTRLKRMRDGFLESRKIHEMEFKSPQESKLIQRRVKRGLDVFVKHYFSLWD